MGFITTILPKRIGGAVLLFMPLLAMGVSLTALYLVIVDSGDAAIVIEGENFSEAEYQTILESSERNLQRAEDAVKSAELVLSFIEGASIVAGIILLGLGVVGVSSIQDLRHDTEVVTKQVIDRLERAESDMIRRVESAEQQVLQRAEQVNALERRLGQILIESQARIDEQVQEANQAAHRSFEALSHHVMAQRLARENNIDAAIQACRDAHDLDPDSMPNNYLLGTLLTRKDELDEAIVHLTEAFQTAHEDKDHSIAPSQAALGLALRRKGDNTDDIVVRNRLYNQAEHNLLQATERDPYLINERGESYHGVLGSLYRRQGRIQDAIAFFERAADVTPRRSYPEINLAILCLADDDAPHAERHRALGEKKALIRLADSPEDYYAKHDIALAILLRGDTEEALAMFDEALDLTPDLMTVSSVMSRLSFLKTSEVDINGLADALDRFMAARERFLANNGGGGTQG